MGSKRESKLDRLRRLAAEHGLRRIDEAAATALSAALAPISDSHFRKILRESGLELAPLVEGIRQDSSENLERTLLALLTELESGHPEARREVIRSRDHARMAQKRNPAPHREETILWMTVWLENPSLFREWLALRKATAARSTPP